MATRNRNRDRARQLANSRAEPMRGDAQASPARTPYWLLWSTGIIAVVLGVVAFLLWGLNGASTLFDMIIALCT